MNKAFTLIEILVVTTIISLLAAAAMVSYSTLNRQSRDAKRKADLEIVRAALEQYRSNNGYYPTGSGTFTAALTASLVSGATKYINSLPTDPLGGVYSYQYTAKTNGCDNSSTFCTSYVIGALLENSSPGCSTTPTSACKSSPSTSCNYCEDPYGN